MTEDVFWIADHDLKECLGGAQETDALMIAALRRRGLKVVHAVAREQRRLMPRARASRALFILNNVQRAHAPLLRLVLRDKRFVRYEHDYLFGQEALAREVVGRSVANVFLSPLHRRSFERRFRLKARAAVYQPSPIPDAFRDRGRRRPPGSVLWMGEAAPGKGLEAAVAYAARRTDARFTFHAFGGAPALRALEAALRRLPHCRFAGPLPRPRRAAAYNAHESFLHLPAWDEPFGRAVMEAYLSGCALIVNGRVGALSYRWDWERPGSVRARLERGVEDFGRRVEAWLKG